ncbi:Glycosyl phosphatidyl inositol protein transamidase complex subunit [Elasticomyces elasticus]|nr:Glycosyl phosphatidyl inositol protein transamidase complex subunit [Elasticomyces elasticus]KAK4969727.1 Glycosyl phosphatidyl inositol protein transamidase complex subunit [Elasticomyces elasticus]
MALSFRNSPVLLKLPPYLSALCLAIGISWLFTLPLDAYSRRTYVSENAILPGQVHTYFGGSEHNVFRAYRQEVYHLSQQSESDRDAGLARIMSEIGLKVASQPYDFTVAGEGINGTNVYGLLQGPRADATEAMVLMAAYRNFNNDINYSGIALALTLARYFKRWSIWSKDIFLLIPSDSVYGPQAWVEAYHHSSTPDATPYRNISRLPIKAGALQAAVALDYPAGPWGQRFDRLDVQYDGINGALPNLDLLNTAVAIASGQMGIQCSLHGLPSSHQHDSYTDRLRTLGEGLRSQAAGHATGPHSAFIPYHVDAITLKTVGDGWHDEMSLGRTTESLFRSINNLLEHLHQSFFFYILLGAGRFISIGNYLPAAMLIAGSFTVTALGLWAQSGQAAASAQNDAGKMGTTGGKEKGEGFEVVKVGGDVALVASSAIMKRVERKMLLPAVVVLAVHLLGFVPLYALVNLPRPSLSLLLLGAAMSTLATLNFSLAFVIGVLASPLSFIRPLPRAGEVTVSKKLDLWTQRAVGWTVLQSMVYAAWVAISPPAILYEACWFLELDIEHVLVEVAKGWNAQGVYTAGMVWGVWWPAWFLGGVVAFSNVVKDDVKEEQQKAVG